MSKIHAATSKIGDCRTCPPSTPDTTSVARMVSRAALAAGADAEVLACKRAMDLLEQATTLGEARIAMRLTLRAAMRNREAVTR